MQHVSHMHHVSRMHPSYAADDVSHMHHVSHMHRRACGGGQVEDVQKILETLDIDEGMWSCIGSSGHTSSDSADADLAAQVAADDLHGHSAPMSFGRNRM